MINKAPHRALGLSTEVIARKYGKPAARCTGEKGTFRHRFFEETQKPEVSLLLPLRDLGNYFWAVSWGLVLNAHFLQADGLGAGRPGG